MLLNLLFILCFVFLYNSVVTAAESTNCPSPTPYKLKPPPLTTKWTSTVGLSPWPEYPRPLLRRDQWLNLNGPWQFKAANRTEDIENPPFGGCFDREILVPFPMESGLSGIMENHMFSWYRKTFVIPKTWSGKIKVNFGAVDYEGELLLIKIQKAPVDNEFIVLDPNSQATIFVNGKRAGFHRGGYFKFSLDLTDLLRGSSQENEMLVFVYDPTNSKAGKQVLEPRHIWYTPSSGIWQTVFLEPVPREYVVNIDIDANMHGRVKARITTSDPASHSPVKLTLFPASDSSPDDPLYPNAPSSAILETQATANTAFEFKIDNPHLWSPRTPHLYHFRVEIGKDIVKSYLGFRTVEKKNDQNGILRPFLNGEFEFQLGTLDQGFWSDGLYTAPTLQAMEFDLKVLKTLGLNAIKKHIKIEPDLFYYACDRIGLLVWQEMPSMNPDLPLPTDDQQKEFVRQLKLMVFNHISFPSIVMWIIPGWGQRHSSPELELAPMIKQMDPSRLVDGGPALSTKGSGDFDDKGHYPYPLCGTPFYPGGSAPYNHALIAVQSVFGGIGHIPPMANLWNVPKALETLNETYEISTTLGVWNFRAIKIFNELREQAEIFSCSAAFWTQTTDVEAETNGLITVGSPFDVYVYLTFMLSTQFGPKQYDRRIIRANWKHWSQLTAAVYAAAKTRKNSTLIESIEQKGFSHNNLEPNM